jgi:NAD(P)H-hydrate repair Nnr-like enzyme with NAD(P)H-hydrate dehydratase domain
MAIPEVMVLTDIEKNTSTIAFDIKPQAVGMVGNWAGEATQKHCTNSDNHSIPPVIDADALNILSKTDPGFRCYRRNRY